MEKDAEVRRCRMLSEERGLEGGRGGKSVQRIVSLGAACRRKYTENGTAAEDVVDGKKIKLDSSHLRSYDDLITTTDQGGPSGQGGIHL